ncbi:unnamed protein product [Rotaria socialis]|uniref:Uncharacterized protein n=1 Tax=Rotaria socialis TaxID=392032 RepID=A0A818PYX4_9BILA|nr:unnamed protein product [Rotaria socialis]CAF4479199.1 unnamed protein product [Rotaria socialis]
MALHNGSLETLVSCGKTTCSTRKFNEKTLLQQVHEYVQDVFRSCLPKSYRIMYYDMSTMALVDLEDQLRNNLNPFQSTIEDIPSSIQLFIVNNSKILSSSPCQTQTQRAQIVINNYSDESSSICESNDDLCNNVTSSDTSQDRSEYLSNITGGLSLTTTPSSIPLQRQHSKLLSRLFFSLDVNPYQRNIYKSDEFKMRKEGSNGRITCVQGCKGYKEKRIQVLPKLRIPSKNLESNVKLMVVVVLEKIEGSMRVWYRYSNKGFLPDQYTKDTDSMNPIYLDLNETNVTKDGDFTLRLHMITKWDKSKKQLEAIYELSEQSVVELHTAAHCPSSPRLLCVLARNGVPDWDTLCLSDFIRTPKSATERSSSSSRDRICSPKRKRSKMNDDDQVLKQNF